MRRKNINHIPVGRLWLLYAALVFLASVIGLRMMYMYFEKSQDYLAEGERRSIKAVEIPSTKGVITDRNGEVLAVTTVLYALAVDLNHLKVKKKDSVFQQRNTKKRRVKFEKKINKLSKILGIAPQKIQNKSLKESKKMRVYLAKKLLPDQIDKIKALKMPALIYERTLKRYYPHGEVLANVIGFSDYVDKGRSGLEKSYDGYLRGKSGEAWMRRDRVGNVTAYLAKNSSYEKGKDLQLTLDARIQSISFFALQRAIDKYHAKSGTVVVLEVKTGNILALASLPSYNANDNSQRVGLGLSAVASQELFEPGSVIKPFTVLAALENKKATANTMLHIGKGRIHKIKVGDRTYKDSSVIEKQDISLAEMLQKSSNVGAIKTGMLVTDTQLRDFFAKSGFGSPTKLALYGGKFAGVLPKANEMTPVMHASMSMGYALNASVLQMARAYAMLANNGMMQDVRLVDNGVEIKTSQVASPKNVKQVVRWLEKVASDDGTAPLAQVKGYRVAGKTGTALTSKGSRGYGKKYIASFIGFVPAENPEIVVATLVEHPKGKVYYGGAVAGPIFSEVAANTLNYLGIKSSSQKSLLSALKAESRKETPDDV